MKRIVFLMLAACFALTAVSAAADVDLSYVLSRDIYAVHDGVMIVGDTLCSRLVTTVLTEEQLSVRPDGGGMGEAAAMRAYLGINDGALTRSRTPSVLPFLAVGWRGSATLNLRTVSFDVNGQRYTFAGQLDAGTEGNIRFEAAFIDLGWNNLDFMLAMDNLLKGRNTQEALAEVRIPVTLSGDREITFTLSFNQLVDYIAIVENAYFGLDTNDSLYFIEGTPMTVTPVE